MFQREDVTGFRPVNYAPLGLLLLCLMLGGCGLVTETNHVAFLTRRTTQLEPKFFPFYHNEKLTLRENRKLAKQVWNEIAATSFGGSASPDYAGGFVEGFADYLLRGGSAQPPLVPPRGYWNLPFKSPQGQHAIDDWYAGFRHGAEECKGRGLRELVVVPSSIYGGPPAGVGYESDSQPSPMASPFLGDPDSLEEVPLPDVVDSRTSQPDAVASGAANDSPGNIVNVVENSAASSEDAATKSTEATRRLAAASEDPKRSQPTLTARRDSNTVVGGAIASDSPRPRVSGDEPLRGRREMELDFQGDDDPPAPPDRLLLLNPANERGASASSANRGDDATGTATPFAFEPDALDEPPAPPPLRAAQTDASPGGRNVTSSETPPRESWTSPLGAEPIRQVRFADAASSESAAAVNQTTYIPASTSPVAPPGRAASGFAMHEVGPFGGALLGETITAGPHGAAPPLRFLVDGDDQVAPFDDDGRTSANGGSLRFVDEDFTDSQDNGKVIPASHGQPAPVVQAAPSSEPSGWTSKPSATAPTSGAYEQLDDVELPRKVDASTSTLRWRTRE